MARNYYLILGVPLDAAPEAIRSAFRRLARRYHPDRGREADSRNFQEIAEAYDVLSDPGRRAHYDRQFRPRPRPVSPRFEGMPGPEPLIPDPVPVAGHPETTHPSFEALLERFARNFTDFHVPKADHAEPLNFELLLSPDEAERGLRIPFQVPVFGICPQCGGTGRDWLFSCRDCGGEGRLVDQEEVLVTVPRGVRDGEMIDVSLDHLGVTNLWLRIHVRVAGHDF